MKTKATPDFTVSDMKRGAKKRAYHRIFILSDRKRSVRYSVKNGGAELCRQNKVYSKTVPLSNVAWIDAIEGQYKKSNVKKKKEPWQ